MSGFGGGEGATTPGGTPISAACQTLVKVHAECAICFNPLCMEPCVVLMESEATRPPDKQLRRVCRHYFHQACIGDVRDGRCPMCRVDFASTPVLPNALEHPDEWFHTVDANADGGLNYEEAIEGLKTCLDLDWRKIETDADQLWPRWDPDRNGKVSLEEANAPGTGMFAYLREHYPKAERPPSPSIRGHPRDWFAYWDEDHSNSLDKDELCRAIIKTARMTAGACEIRAVHSFLDSTWFLFDPNGDGTLSIDEFVAREGMHETLCASFPKDAL